MKLTYPVMASIAVAAGAISYMAGCEADPSSPTRPKTAVVLPPESGTDNALKRENEKTKPELPATGSDLPDHSQAQPIEGAKVITADAGLKMALFSDAGSLWSSNMASAANLASMSPAQQIANTRAIRASVGASLIWDSPFGPLRVDYAYPIAKQSADVAQRLNFSAGAF